MEEIYSKIKLYDNFPRAGIKFRHIGPLLADPKAFKSAVDLMIQSIDPAQIDVICGLESRGFIFATAMALELHKPQVMIRKPSKLPGEKYTTEYSKEYGSSCIMELEYGYIKPGDRVLLVDDLLATGGTLLAGAALIKQSGGVPTGFITLIELDGLEGFLNISEKWPQARIQSVLNYPANSDTLIPTKPVAVCKALMTNGQPCNLKARESGYCGRHEVIPVPPTHPPPIEVFEFRPSKYMFEDTKPVLMWHPSLESMAQNILCTSNFRPSWIRLVLFSRYLA